MTESEAKALVCRQCGKEFHFTGAEQEFYMQQGWAEPSHCPQCRSARRKRELRLICSGCGILLGKEEPVYCSKCVENLKLEAEHKLYEQQDKIEAFKASLEHLDDLEQKLVSTTIELEKSQQVSRELKDSIVTLQEAASRDGLRDSLQQLNEEFGAFKQSYACDVDKLTGLLLEIQDGLTKQQDAGLWHRVRMAFGSKTGRHETASG